VTRIEEAPLLSRRTLLLFLAVALLPIPAAPREGGWRPAPAGLAAAPLTGPCGRQPWSIGAPGQAAARPERVTRPSIAAFCRLGAWVDHYDLGLDPATAARELAGHRVGTLYLQTGRFSDGTDIIQIQRIGQWVEAAHAAGLRVVAWYLPGYGRWLERDVRRTLAAVGFQSPAGQRFDAVAVDIEYREATPDVATFNRGVATHLERVRRQVGPDYPLGAIVPAPRGMALAAARWAGFPWGSIARDADVVQTMGYWSYRGSCQAQPSHCAYPYTTANLADAARLTGLPVHAIGGVADAVSPADVDDFARAARDARAVGASLYDYATTVPSFWPSLEPLDQLGG
jgi:hypothetical protein